MDRMEDKDLIFTKKLGWEELTEMLPCGVEIEQVEDENGDTSKMVNLKLDFSGNIPGLPSRLELLEIRKAHFEIYESLTRREMEIIKGIVNGSNNSEIANVLFISRRTVEQHRKNIRRKFPYQNEFELLKFAQAFDLLQ